MQNKFEILIDVLIIASILLIMIDYVYKLDTTQRYSIFVFDLLVVSILIYDFTKKLYVAKRKRRGFVIKNCYEFPAMIPLIIYSFFDTHFAVSVILRSLRFITLFRLVRLYHVLKYFEKNEFIYLAVFTGITIIFGAMAMYIVESPNEYANIKNIGDSFWWSIGTVTTVAYGDVYPITISGKVVAGFIMFASIGILGAFISTLGTKIIKSQIKPLQKDYDKNENNPLQKDQPSTSSINKIKFQEQNQQQKLYLESNNNPCSNCRNYYPKYSSYCNSCGLKLFE